MDQLAYIIFGILSLIFFVATIIVSLKVYRSKGRGKRFFTSLHMFTLGVFLATVLIFIPVYYTGYDFGDSYAYLRPFLISIHHSLRVFILDGEFDTIRDAVFGTDNIVHVLFSLYAAFLYVIAPVLTFSNVLSLFKNIQGEIRFLWHRKRPFYIFSELNERSVALAESVSEIKKKERPVIVFADVFEKDEEDDYELLLRVHDINAICLKKDITRLNVKKKNGQVEFFLLGDDESENIEQAIKLTEENKDSNTRSIFLFSSRPSAGYILDSIEKGEKILSSSLAQIVEDSPQKVIENFEKINFQIDDGFYLRRIDSVELLAQRILKDNDLLDTLFRRAMKDHVISILLVGLGKYGRQFLKVALWLYQIYGLKLEINIIDSKDTDNLEKTLRQECPEIISTNYEDNEGDACYSIKFIGGKDCFTSDLDELFTSVEYQDNLKKTQLAIVALGDDEKNIETAVTLRRIFETISTAVEKDSSGEEGISTEPTMIYSIVYDDKKATSLSISGDTLGGKSNNGLKNYRGVPYDIHFVGSLKSQFSYYVIANQKDVEAKAIKQHLDWVTKAGQLRSYYGKEGYDEFRSLLDAYFARKGKVTWGDERFFTKDGHLDYAAAPNPQEVRNEVEKYFNFEYYRLSSIAKAIQNEIVNNNSQLKDYFSAFDADKKHQVEVDAEAKKEIPIPICSCECCIKKRITEHMRWNAYMRVIGYKYAEKRNDLTKHHNDLIPWQKLDELEKYKD